MFKHLFCKHKWWEFYPDAWFRGQKTHGLTIHACILCGKVKASDYAK